MSIRRTPLGNTIIDLGDGEHVTIRSDSVSVRVVAPHVSADGEMRGMTFAPTRFFYAKHPAKSLSATEARRSAVLATFAKARAELDGEIRVLARIGTDLGTPADYHFTVDTNPAAPGWVGNASVAVARATCDGGPCAADLHPLAVVSGAQHLAAGLRAAFGKDGTVTAGNASGIVDGAAMLVVTTAQRAKELGINLCII